MDTSDVFLNATAKKIQRNFREYRVNLYRKKISQLDLNTFSKNNSFNKFRMHMMKKEVVKPIKEYLSILQKTVNKELKTKHQLILSCYMMQNYTDEVFG